MQDVPLSRLEQPVQTYASAQIVEPLAGQIMTADPCAFERVAHVHRSALDSRAEECDLAPDAAGTKPLSEEQQVRLRTTSVQGVGDEEDVHYRAAATAPGVSGTAARRRACSATVTRVT